MAKTRILVVDDEEGMLEVCAETLGKLADTEVLVQNDSREAARQITTESLDMLVVDIRMPGLSGVELLRIARQHDPNLSVLMITAFPTVETAVLSMKLGATDYITKPFAPEDLLATARRLVEEKTLRDENRLLTRHLERAYAFDQIVGTSPVMQNVFETIRRVAPTDTDVLILGETGTGKELVARSIYNRSNRRHGRFVPVDCGAIPEDLLESEFFGHERGAFTGAHTRSLGLLEFANNGVFFLDEIGELPPRLQSKLLRVLQERKVRRVGGMAEIDVDVRIIAATSRNLDEDVQQGRFRADLFYRINVARIELPPLRLRGEDIGQLISHFFSQCTHEMGKEPVTVDDEVIEVLSRYAWPGNVRELHNIIKRTLVMARSGVICLSDLPDEIVAKAGDDAGAATDGFFSQRERQMAQFDKGYLEEMLKVSQGDVACAARKAQVPRGTLYRLLKKYNLNPADYRP